MLKGLRAMLAWVLVLFVTFLAVTFFVDRHIMRVVSASLVDENAANATNARAIVVLGAGVRPDGSLTPMLKDRLDKAYELFERGASKRIIVSGDHGASHYDEPGHMKAYLVSKGIPKEDVFEDHAGFCTYDTVYRAKAIFDAAPAIFVTQEYHLPRTLYIAYKLGLPAVGVKCDTRRYVGQSQRDIREILARVKDFFLCEYKPNPKYLGQKIDLAGSGDQTDDKPAALVEQDKKAASKAANAGSSQGDSDKPAKKPAPPAPNASTIDEAGSNMEVPGEGARKD